MKVFSITWYEKLRKLDYTVLISAVTLSIISLLTLAGSANDYGVKYFYIQLVATALGVSAMIIISTIDYEEIADQFSPMLLGFSVFLLALTLIIGIGDGNKSWIRFSFLPIGIQPSEFVKVMYIVTFSKHLQKLSGKVNHIKSIIELGIHAGLIIGLVLLQGDLGSALVFMFLTAAMLYVAGFSVWYFVSAGSLGIVMAPLLWRLLKPYQKSRILAGFWPETDPSNKGFQALMSKKAIAAGGFFGAGFSGGTEYQEVPFAHTDFIFAITGEKFGFFGALLVIALLCVLVIRSLVLAYKMRGTYASYMCVGVAAVLLAQATENIGMCLAKLPVIGITLPFMSAGGSSVFAIYFLIGLAHSVYGHEKRFFFKRKQ